MSQYNKQRHAAAMLAHNIGAGVQALDDLTPDMGIENFDSLSESFLKLGNYLLRLSEIQVAKNNLLSTHN